MPDRDKILSGPTVEVATGCGTLYVTINYTAEGNPREVFARLGKAGGCPAATCEAIGRLASLAFSLGADIPSVQKQLSGITCHRFNGSASSCADAVARALGVTH